MKATVWQDMNRALKYLKYLKIMKQETNLIREASHLPKN